MQKKSVMELLLRLMDIRRIRANMLSNPRYVRRELDKKLVSLQISSTVRLSVRSTVFRQGRDLAERKECQLADASERVLQAYLNFSSKSELSLELLCAAENSGFVYRNHLHTIAVMSHVRRQARDQVILNGKAAHGVFLYAKTEELFREMGEVASSVAVCADSQTDYMSPETIETTLRLWGRVNKQVSLENCWKMVCMAIQMKLPRDRFEELLVHLDGRLLATAFTMMEERRMDDRMIEDLLEENIQIRGLATDEATRILRHWDDGGRPKPLNQFLTEAIASRN